MPDLLTLCLLLIPALPLAGALLVAALGPWLLRHHSHWVIIAALFGSFACSATLLNLVTQAQNMEAASTDGSPLGSGYERVVTLWTWANVPKVYEIKNSFLMDNGWRDFRIDVALRADALTSMMLVMVTFVATLVAIFAQGYMTGDRGYWRFFSYIGLFVFSMTMLVSVSNFVLLFVFWEAVGVCSYLLIGFWYEKPAAAAAGMKAFLVNRVGDFGFAIALFLIWTTYGTLNYHDTLPDGSTDAKSIRQPFMDIAVLDGPGSKTITGIDGNAYQVPRIVRGVLGQTRLVRGDYLTGGIATAICLLLLLGACGKSAQFPLHVWLPDAMEGPTPVSALIHAATMVTAGVYMVARCTPLFMASPTAQLVVACVGGFTALLAGLIALTQYDLKRVLAYSTVSQLGYMFLALGTGMFAGVTGGMFHLFTHAFFKALLFLGSGSVMHAMGGVIDMRQFGGLRRLMPHTHWTFLVGCLALAGVFPLAGFWSKDAVLGAVHDKVHQIEHVMEHEDHPHDTGHPPAAAPSKLANPIEQLSAGQLATFHRVYQLLYYSALFTAFLTAFYTFRAFCLTFYGEEKIPSQAGHHAHESPPAMLAPLVVLAICSVMIGAILNNLTGGDWGVNHLANFLGHTPSLAAGAIQATRLEHPEFHLSVAGLSTIVALSGIGLALYLYLGDRQEVGYLARLCKLEGAEKLTDPQWVLQLQSVPWIAFVTKKLRQIHLGWTVTVIGYLLGAITLVFFSAPLILLGNFISPYKLSHEKFYFDELYDAVIVTPLRWLANIFYWLDRRLVDGLVNFVGAIPPAVGALMRSLQMGLVQFYALAMVLGALILIFAGLVWAGH